ncbi:hypothetical protein WME97_45550 [Sorangium sp. So ce367]|uniref:hypothetical protein n=1 Tax=Sorangium sp. So ce367 TaxID=3133305 RepID=UPI003F63CBF9
MTSRQPAVGDGPPCAPRPASTLRRVVALGDEAAAQVVHEASGRLLVVPLGPEGWVGLRR